VNRIPLPGPAIGRVLLAEGGLLALAAIPAGLHDKATGVAVLAGGLIFLLPQAWFAWRAFRHRGAGTAPQVVRGFFRAEAGKFLLTAAGFAVAFAGLGAGHAGYLLGTYVVLYAVNSVLLALSGAF
jgi:ATP synthase protein I